MYYVIEFQTGTTGAAIVNTYNNRPDAEEKFYEIMKYAAKSDVPNHGAMIVTGELFVVKSSLAFREQN